MFKVGDEVRRIEVKSGSYKDIQIGEVTTVGKIRERIFEGDTGNWYENNSFELVKKGGEVKMSEQFKEGDSIKCVTGSAGRITEGRIYKVSGFDCDGWPRFINDDQSKDCMNPSYFTLFIGSAKVNASVNVTERRNYNLECDGEKIDIDKNGAVTIKNGFNCSYYTIDQLKARIKIYKKAIDIVEDKPTAKKTGRPKSKKRGRPKKAKTSKKETK